MNYDVCIRIHISGFIVPINRKVGEYGQHCILGNHQENKKRKEKKNLQLFYLYLILLKTLNRCGLAEIWY